MKKFATIPFTLECVLYPDSDSVSYVIVRDPDGRVSSVETNFIGVTSHIMEVLDEFVFSKNLPKVKTPPRELSEVLKEKYNFKDEKK